MKAIVFLITLALGQIPLKCFNYSQAYGTDTNCSQFSDAAILQQMSNTMHIS